MEFVDAVSQSTVLSITLLFMAIGLVFTIIPPLPGTLVIWAAAIFYGVALGWEQLGWILFSALTILMVIGIGGDIAAGHFGAKMGGASCSSVVVGGILGFMIGIALSFTGIFLLGCIGGFIATMGGILLVERWIRGEWAGAIQATKGYMAGATLGAVAKVISGVVMVGLFLWAVT